MEGVLARVWALCMRLVEQVGDLHAAGGGPALDLVEARQIAMAGDGSIGALFCFGWNHGFKYSVDGKASRGCGGLGIRAVTGRKMSDRESGSSSSGRRT